MRMSVSQPWRGELCKAALTPTLSRERERGIESAGAFSHPSLAQNASNSASVAKDFCAPRLVTEKAA